MSAGVFDGKPVVDLNYEEDKAVTVISIGGDRRRRIRRAAGLGRRSDFFRRAIRGNAALGKKSVSELIAAQRAVLAGLDDAESKLVADLPPLG